MSSGVMADIINQILRGKWLDPDTGKPVIIPIDSIIIEAGIAKNAADLIASLNMGKKFAIVSDENTHEILAHHIEKSLGEMAVSIVLPDGVAPVDKIVDKLVDKISLCDGVIAVGGGTINDICKYTSYLSGKPYAVFGTAPSMNGYSSANASIIVHGHKKTLKAHLPRGIFLDLDILCAAPKRLIRSGLGDSLCRPTAQADWLLSHLIFATPYKTAPFALLKDYESDLFARSKELISGDREIMHLLAKTLILSGFGMYICGGSYPASQGEHLIAHTWETVVKSGHKTYHGEEIGVTTISMGELQESILQNKPIFKPNYDYENAIVEFFGREIGAHCINEYAKKIITKERAEELNHYIELNWANISTKLQEVILPAEFLEKVLSNAGAPTSPSDLGWDLQKYNDVVKHAKYMRDRFTFLDFV
jgi:glycerol-1-phosphate dehydrogenase [NAD(P)+]